MEHTNVEPIETFLESLVCVDRLSMYREAIDLMKALQRGSMIDAMNTILPNSSDLTPNEVEERINKAMRGHLKTILNDFGIITHEGSIPFLTRLVRQINLIDVWDENEYVINVATHALGEPHHKLHAILTVIDPLDEEEYYQCVQSAPLSLIERIIDIHTQRFEEAQLEQDMLEVQEIVEPKDLTILRKVVRNNRQMIVSRMFEDGVVTDLLPVNLIIDLANPYFSDLNGADTKTLARELLGVFLLSGEVGDTLIELVRVNAYSIVNDDILLTKINPVLTSMYMELSL